MTINSSLPSLIKQKLAADKDFLSSINCEPMGRDSPKKRYWSFPEFKEINTQLITHQISRMSETNDRTEIGRSMTPRRTKANKIKEETMQDYLNFPDPQLYLVGF